MGGGGVAVDLGAARTAGFFVGVCCNCFSSNTASAKRAARSLMFFAFMGVGDGRSLYWMMVLTGRLFPSTTFSWTTAWKPFGPSIGVRTGSSEGVSGMGETAALRALDAFLESGPAEEGDVPSE